jgi:hypothetical protein
VTNPLSYGAALRNATFVLPNLATEALIKGDINTGTALQTVFLLDTPLCTDTK